MIYDFRNGFTAEFLLKKLKSSIYGASNFEIDLIEDIPHHEIEIIDNSFIRRRGEQEYYMFAYKNKYQTQLHSSLPKYHIADCETREIYTGYRFANHMPVDIYCINQRKNLGPQNLDLCRNCINTVNFNSISTPDTPSFDRYAVVCEECEIDLSERRAEFFCEVHHIDGNKSNNSLKNLRCLCVNCHSQVDKKHRRNYSKEPNLMKLNQFKTLFGNQ